MIRWRPEVATSRIKTLNFSGYTFKLLNKNFIWGGPGHLVVNINVSLLYTYTVEREKIKETENEKTLGFADIIFIIGYISIWGASLLPLLPTLIPLATPMIR